MNRRSFIASLMASTVVPFRLPNVQRKSDIYIAATAPSISAGFESLDWVPIGQVVTIGDVGYVDAVGDMGYMT